MSFTLQYQNKTLDLSKPVIMGILNVTPDSFSDGGQYTTTAHATAQYRKMIQEGATIIDIGAESTRPGHAILTFEEEWVRLQEILPTLVGMEEAWISLDTYKAKTAKAALELGVHMINDVWGLQKDPDMASVIADYGCPVCIMHNQDDTNYQHDIMDSIKEFFYRSIDLALQKGASSSQIILDPGIGFGKTLAQNYEVLSRLEELHTLGLPILLGTSRKSLIGKVLDVPPAQRVSGTLATTVIGYEKGAHIFRVHDVLENLDALKISELILRGKTRG